MKACFQFKDGFCLRGEIPGLSCKIGQEINFSHMPRRKVRFVCTDHDDKDHAYFDQIDNQVFFKRSLVRKANQYDWIACTRDSNLKGNL